MSHSIKPNPQDKGKEREQTESETKSIKETGKADMKKLFNRSRIRIVPSVSRVETKKSTSSPKGRERGVPESTTKTDNGEGTSPDRAVNINEHLEKMKGVRSKIIEAIRNIGKQEFDMESFMPASYTWKLNDDLSDELQAAEKLAESLGQASEQSFGQASVTVEDWYRLFSVLDFAGHTLDGFSLPNLYELYNSEK